MGNLFSRIDQDLKEGRKKKACDRLRNMINQFPNDLSLRSRLGHIYYEAGFIDEAGKFWILSEPENDEMKNAVELYKKTLGNSGSAILKDIVFRGNKNQMNEYSVKILTELENDSFKKTNHIPDFEPKTREKGKYSEVKNGNELSDFIGICLLVGWFIVLPILGIVTLFNFMISLFSR